MAAPASTAAVAPLASPAAWPQFLRVGWAGAGGLGYDCVCCLHHLLDLLDVLALPGVAPEQLAVLFAAGLHLRRCQLVGPYLRLLALGGLLLHGNQDHAVGTQRVGVESALAVVAVLLDGGQELGKVAAAGGFEIHHGAALALGAVDEQVGAHFDE